MLCDEARDRLSAYRDDELTAVDRRTLENHLDNCRACKDVWRFDMHIGGAVRQRGWTLSPAELTTKVRAAIESDNAQQRTMVARAAVETPVLRQMNSPLPPARGFLLQAVLLLFMCLFSIAVTWWLVSTAAQAERIEREILSAHIRSLLQDTPVQIASSDQHAVRPWFAGRADFAPAVRNLSAEGFVLIGGRLDYAADRRIGVVVYKRRLHTINVFVWPSTNPSESAPRTITRNGYNLISWTRDGVAHWAISDLNVMELTELQRLL